MKNKYDSPLVFRALEFFIKNPYDEIYLREFGRKLNISPNSAQRFLDKFLSEEFITEIRRGNMRYFKANLECVTLRHIKITYSLNELEKSGIVEYFRERDVSSLVVFGSVAKGVDDLKSDVDLVCISVSKKVDIYEFEKKLNRKVQVHFFSWAEWKKQALRNKAFYQEVIRDGIALIGEKPIVG